MQRRPCLVFGALTRSPWRVSSTARSTRSVARSRSMSPHWRPSSSPRRRPVSNARLTIGCRKCPESLQSVSSICSALRMSSSACSGVGGLWTVATLRAINPFFSASDRAMLSRRCAFNTVCRASGRAPDKSFPCHCWTCSGRSLWAEFHREGVLFDVRRVLHGVPVSLASCLERWRSTGEGSPRQ